MKTDLPFQSHHFSAKSPGTPTSFCTFMAGVYGTNVLFCFLFLTFLGLSFQGFYRRMVKERLHNKFVCSNGGNCAITSSNRTSCKICRFNKCQSVGMTLEGETRGSYEM